MLKFFFSKDGFVSPEDIFLFVDKTYTLLRKVFFLGISNLNMSAEEGQKKIVNLLDELWETQPFLYEDIYQIVKWHVHHNKKYKTAANLLDWITQSKEISYFNKETVKKYIQSDFGNFKKFHEVIRREIIQEAASEAKKYAVKCAMNSFGDVPFEKLSHAQRLQFFGYLVDGALKFGTTDCIALCGTAAVLLKQEFGDNISIQLAGPTYYIHYFLIINNAYIWDVWDKKIYPFSEAKYYLNKLSGVIKPHTDKQNGEVKLGHKKVYENIDNECPPLDEITPLFVLKEVPLSSFSLQQLNGLKAAHPKSHSKPKQAPSLVDKEHKTDKVKSPLSNENKLLTLLIKTDNALTPLVSQSPSFAHNDVWELSEKIPFFEALQLFGWASGKLKYCEKPTLATFQFDNIQVCEASAEKTLNQYGTSLEAALDYCFSKYYSKCDFTIQQQFKSMIIDIALGNVDNKTQQAFNYAIKNSNAHLRWKELDKVREIYWREKEMKNLNVTGADITYFQRPL